MFVLMLPSLFILLSTSQDIQQDCPAKFVLMLPSTVASEASNVHFERRLQLLRDLTTHWKNADKVAVMEVDDGKCISFV